jgi:hypothetical protein
MLHAERQREAVAEHLRGLPPLGSGGGQYVRRGLAEVVGFLNWDTGVELALYAARLYSLMRPVGFNYCAKGLSWDAVHVGCQKSACDASWRWPASAVGHHDQPCLSACST